MISVKKIPMDTFVGILEDLLAEQAADPAFSPARPVEPAFARLPPDVEAGTLIEDPTTAQVADLANGLYEVTLQVLELGPVLTALPVGPSRPGRTTGPTFDIARPAIFLLPHQDAAWKIIKERLDALQQACASLGQQAGLGALAPARRQAAVDEPGHRQTRAQHRRLTAAFGPW